jgi:uncharacterized protein YrzB (UPF0473 family)
MIKKSSFLLSFFLLILFTYNEKNYIIYFRIEGVFTMERKLIQIEEANGNLVDAELITYLVDDENQKQYIVYSKGETSGNDGDEVIYISRIINSSGTLKIEEIIDDTEWQGVQKLLKMIANS